MTLNTEKLVSLLGSEDAARRFVEMFRQQWPEQFATLKQALADADWENASNTAHSLKSQCRYLGLDTLAETLQNIENQPNASHDLSLFPPGF
ncbi:MAG: Hpt domain-containing protein [Saprospiraceae bacterium]|nr:Hpt domain-containing protein [Saprospiraceae bacterium]